MLFPPCTLPASEGDCTGIHPSINRGSVGDSGSGQRRGMIARRRFRWVNSLANAPKGTIALVLPVGAVAPGSTFGTVSPATFAPATQSTAPHATRPAFNCGSPAHCVAVGASTATCRQWPHVRRGDRLVRDLPPPAMSTGCNPSATQADIADHLGASTAGSIQRASERCKVAPQERNRRFVRRADHDRDPVMSTRTDDLCPNC